MEIANRLLIKVTTFRRHNIFAKSIIEVKKIDN